MVISHSKEIPASSKYSKVDVWSKKSNGFNCIFNK